MIPYGGYNGLAEKGTLGSSTRSRYTNHLRHTSNGPTARGGLRRPLLPDGALGSKFDDLGRVVQDAL
jgi:hypothetical protein